MPRPPQDLPRVPDTLRDALGYALRRAQLAVFLDFTDLLADLELRPASYSVLVVIDGNAGLSQRSVAELLGIKQANLVAIINALAGRGLTERRASPQDKRKHALHLTAKGRELLQRAMALQQQHEERLAQQLGAGNRAQLLALLEKLAGTAQEHDS